MFEIPYNGHPAMLAAREIGYQLLSLRLASHWLSLQRPPFLALAFLTTFEVTENHRWVERVNERTVDSKFQQKYSINHMKRLIWPWSAAMFRSLYDDPSQMSMELIRVRAAYECNTST